MNKYTLALIIFGAILFSQCTPKKDAVIMSGNPVLEGWYADPEGAIFGDKYWIFPTYSARFDDQVFFDAFSSEDLVTWKKHSRILDTSRVSWAWRAMWAPCVVEKSGKYFLFFGANDVQKPENDWYEEGVNDSGGIGVAVSDSPEGPYQDYLSKPLIDEFYNGAQPIDQFVFKDHDEQYYLIYGGWRHCNIARLDDDFTAIVPFEDGEMVKEITPEGYVEGPVMFWRNGWYYLMWSEGNWTDQSYKVSYGRSQSVFGPFDKIAVVLESDTTVATGAGHHSVINIPSTDDWYAIYHRRPIPNEDRDHRVTCIDRMYFDDEGQILPIKMTFEGVERRNLSGNNQ